MTECMTFPDTVEEFMDFYKIVDTEQVYTNGMEMVPIYRMRQWFEHKPEIVRCKDCKHWDKTWTNDWAKDYHYCPMVDGVRKASFYCADAERRTND